MMPIGKSGHRHWSFAANRNADAASSATEDVDVVFLGDSITEGWLGTSHGFENGRKQQNPAVFRSLFNHDDGGKYEGLALGISGDTVRLILFICYKVYEMLMG